MSSGDWLVEHEALVRVSAFLLFLALLLAAERLWPLRRDARAAPRQLANLGLMLLNTALLRFALPLVAVAWAINVHTDGGGLFGRIDWPPALEVLLAVVLLDLAIYWQHRLMHLVPVLWRLHRVHHSDLAFDVTTGVRFHPLEIAVSMGLKLALISIIGPHPLAVVLFEILLSLGSLFTHADFALPARLDRAVRVVLVTPSMHRVHHSVRVGETNSNYGFHLSVWDRLFRSYRAAPAESEQAMPIGLDRFRDAQGQRLAALLLQPFRSSQPSDQPESQVAGQPAGLCRYGPRVIPRGEPKGQSAAEPQDELTAPPSGEHHA